MMHPGPRVRSGALLLAALVLICCDTEIIELLPGRSGPECPADADLCNGTTDADRHPATDHEGGWPWTEGQDREAVCEHACALLDECDYLNPFFPLGASLEACIEGSDNPGCRHFWGLAPDTARCLLELDNCDIWRCLWPWRALP